MLKDGEVEIIQYIRPNGLRKRLLADIDKEHADKAKNYRFSCEWMTGGLVMLYGRRHDQTDEDELTEMAENGPGNNTPNDALIRLIDRLTAKQTKRRLRK